MTRFNPIPRGLPPKTRLKAMLFNDYKGLAYGKAMPKATFQTPKGSLQASLLWGSTY